MTLEGRETGRTEAIHAGAPHRMFYFCLTRVQAFTTRVRVSSDY